MNIIAYVVNFNADTIDKNTSDALVVENAVMHAYDSVVKRGRNTKLKNINTG